MATKKRKVDTECRVFNEKWGEKYFFVEADNHPANCLICSESIAVLKEYYLRRHYETKHLGFGTVGALMTSARHRQL